MRPVAESRPPMLANIKEGFASCRFDLGGAGGFLVCSSSGVGRWGECTDGTGTALPGDCCGCSRGTLVA